MRKNEEINNAMTTRMEEIVSSILNSGGILKSCKVRKTQFIRSHEGKFLWKVFLSSSIHENDFLFIKAIPPNKRNIPEINLYKNNPTSLQNFFPETYHFSKKYRFYWILMEGLDSIPEPKLCIKDFETPLNLIAKLHAAHYSKNNILQNEKLKWIPNFRKEWNKRTNKIWMALQLRKYMRKPETSEAMIKDYSFLRSIITLLSSKSKLLLNLPHTITHGCLTTHHFMESFQNSRLKLIDWATISFAPPTIDLVDLIERGIREYAQDQSEIFKFRKDCLSLYGDFLNKENCRVKREDIEKWYKTTLVFKTAGEIIWKELKKMGKGEDSKYFWYKEELKKLLSE